MWLSAAALVAVGAMFFFMRQSDVLAPEPQEISVDLPNAFKE